MLRGSDLLALYDKVNVASNRLRFLLEPRAAYEKGVCFGFQLFSFCGVKLTLQSFLIYIANGQAQQNVKHACTFFGLLKIHNS